MEGPIIHSFNAAFFVPLFSSKPKIKIKVLPKKCKLVFLKPFK
jgi:hypothetical protein